MKNLPTKNKTTERMIIIWSIVSALLVSIYFVGTPYVYAQLPFGGAVVFLTVCDEGELLTVYEPPSSTFEYMWAYGNLPYQTYVPPHPNQWMLGEWGAFLTCTEGLLTIGGGNLILYHGASL